MDTTAFYARGIGKTPQQAFNQAWTQAAVEDVFSRRATEYSGTIAEKETFTVIQKTPLPFKCAIELAMELVDNRDPRISDEWGPAGVIPVRDEKDTWLFFGRAAW